MFNIEVLSLVGPEAQTISFALLVIATLVSLWALRKKPKGLTVAIIVALILGFIAWLVLFVIWNPWPGQIPLQIMYVGTLAAFILAALVVRFHWSNVVALVAVLVGFFGIYNIQFQQYPTVGSLNAEPVTPELKFEDFKAGKQPKKIRGKNLGAVVEFPLEAKESHFQTRDAQAYIPPAYWSKPDQKYPLVVLMAGNPGSPSDWFVSGWADRAASKYALEHDGVSPIIVSVDATGTYLNNPICMDTQQYKVMTYLTKDVPSGIQKTFPINPDRNTWTVGGLSYGGTCSLQVITEHPEVYRNFMDFSGEREPTVGEHKKTVDQYFGGNEQAYQEHNPETLLKREANTGRYRGINGKFIAGDQDKLADDALPNLSALSNAAGMKTDYSTVPGSHNYEVWRTAFGNNFEWLAARGGLK